jgi:hypothetical protein
MPLPTAIHASTTRTSSWRGTRSASAHRFDVDAGGRSAGAAFQADELEAEAGEGADSGSLARAEPTRKVNPTAGGTVRLCSEIPSHMSVQTRTTR